MIRTIQCLLFIPFLPILYTIMIVGLFMYKLLSLSEQILYPEEYEKEVYTYEFESIKKISKQDKTMLDKLLCYYFRIEDYELKTKLIDGASFMCKLERNIE